MEEGEAPQKSINKKIILILIIMLCILLVGAIVLFISFNQKEGYKDNQDKIINKEIKYNVKNISDEDYLGDENISLNKELNQTKKEYNISKGFNINLKTGERFEFYINSNIYYLFVTNQEEGENIDKTLIINNEENIPLGIFNLQINKQKYLDVDKNGIQDIEVMLNSIDNDISSLFIKEIKKVELKENIPEISNPTILLIVDDNLRGKLDEELETYGQDIKRELGLQIVIIYISPRTNVKSIKDFIVSTYEQNKLNGLKGILLIGDIPSGAMYHPNTGGIFLSQGFLLEDSIYKDILNKCAYSQEKDAFSYEDLRCQTSTTIQPYWVARITPNSANEDDLTLLKEYFKRNHEFRTGQYEYNKKILLYHPILSTDYEDEEREKTILDVKDALLFLGTYRTQNYNFIYNVNDRTYLEELKKPFEYELIFYNGHGDPTYQQSALQPNNVSGASFFFAEFRSCSVGRFVVEDYMVGKYLFEGRGLITLGASTPIYGTSEPNKILLYLLSKGLPFFEALKIRGQGASNILGDPTLKMRYNQQNTNYDLSDPIIVVNESSLYFSNTQLQKNLEIKNNGESQLELVVEMRYNQREGMQFIEGTQFQFSGFGSEKGTFTLEPTQEGIVSINTLDFFPYDQLNKGVYTGTLFIISNDPIKPLEEIPFEIEKI